MHACRSTLEDPTYLGRAIDSRSGLDCESDTFAKRVADEGFRIADNRNDFSAGAAFVRQVFHHLPARAQALRAARGRALGELYAAAAFSLFAQARPAAWRHVLHALWEYPPLLRNRGLLSVAAQTLLRGKPWAGRRRGAVVRP